MRSNRTRRLTAGAALVCGAAVLLTGCMRMDMDMTVSENDTISGTLVAAAKDSALRSLGEDPETFFDKNKDEALKEAPTGATAEPYSKNGYTGVEVTFENTPLDEFNEGETSFGNTAEDNEGEPLKITREGDTFVVTGAVDLAFEEGMAAALTRDMEATISLTFPGKVTESTGTISGNKVTWKPRNGEVTEISATADATPSGGSLVVLWIVLGAVVVVVAALTIAVVIVRRRRRAPAVAAEASGAPTGPAPQPYEQPHQADYPPSAQRAEPYQQPPAPPARPGE